MTSTISSLIWCTFTVTTSFVLGVGMAKVRLGWVPWGFVLNNTALIGIAYIVTEGARAAGAPFWAVFPPYIVFCLFGVWPLSFWLRTGKWPASPWPSWLRLGDSEDDEGDDE